MLEGLAGQAASTGRRTGSCCCSCCRSAISVGEARWSGPLELPQCLQTAPLHCPSASRQLLYTVCRCLQIAPLHCLPVPPDSSSTLSAGASRQLLYTVCRCLQTAPLHCPSASWQLLYTVSWLVVTLLLPVLLASASFVGERGGELREAGWKHGWRVRSQRLL